MAARRERNAGFTLRRIVLGAAVLALFVTGARAAPFVPASDNTILEYLPDAGDSAARALRARHRELAADPNNLKLALDVAHGDLDRSRALGDPRFLGRAEAAMAPWPASVNQPDVTLLRAVILQSNHDFTGALILVDKVLRDRPRDAQAWLTKAAIRQAQADYKAAAAACGQFATSVIGLAPDICTASVMSLTGYAPLALRAVDLSLKVNAAEAAREPAVTMWGLTLAAETADRLEDPAAEAWFGRAMALNPEDPYLLGAWSDFLLDHGRPREVIALLSAKTRIDPLLLRLALAEQAVQNRDAAGHVADLAARFEASRLRGDTVHRREEARFQLALLHDNPRALVLAQENWKVQREPADARILLEAANAAGVPAAAAPAIAWLQNNNVQDKRLTTLAAQLRAAQRSKG